MHISRSSINASRAPSNWSRVRDAFVSFFLRGGVGSEGNSNIHTFPNARKNTERDV